MPCKGMPCNLLCTEDGKLQLSLILFKLTSPKWQLVEAARFTDTLITSSTHHSTHHFFDSSLD